MTYVQTEFPFMNDLPKSVPQASTFWAKCKTFGNFLIGEWARPTGIEYHALKKTDKSISIFEAYERYKTNTLTVEKAVKVSGQTEKIAKAAAKEAGKKVAKEAGKGFFKSLGKMFAKYAMPVLLWLEPISNAFSEMKNGGNIISIAKEFGKGMCGMAGYTLGTLFATAVLGLTTGFWAFAGTMVIGALGGMACNYVAKAILGESTEEKIARQKKEENNNNTFFANNDYPNFYEQNRQQLAGASFGQYNRYYRPVNVPEIMQKAEATFQSSQNIFLKRNQACV